MTDQTQPAAPTTAGDGLCERIEAAIRGIDAVEGDGGFCAQHLSGELITRWEREVIAKAAATVVAATIAALQDEVARLREALKPQWFYHPDYTDVCQYGPLDVIDDYYDPEPGNHVLEVQCATPVPSIWCAVNVRTDEEMDALGTDDRIVFSEHATEEDARKALGAEHG